MSAVSEIDKAETRLCKFHFLILEEEEEVEEEEEKKEEDDDDDDDEEAVYDDVASKLMLWQVIELVVLWMLYI